MIGAVGDLVEDITVRLGSIVNIASDTGAVIRRRRGGSAANAAVAVARLGWPARFIGQVGDDAVGTMLTDALTRAGVDARVRRGGRSGTIVVLIDEAGERTFLTDRGACTLLDEPDAAWLEGLSVLHVPLYSLVGQPLASTTHTLIGWAHDRGVAVSVDASSAAVIAERGVTATIAELQAVAPDVFLCNELEAHALGGVHALRGIARGATIVKRGSNPTTVLHTGGLSFDVAVERLAGVVDTTGAGDAFAAGFLVAWTDGADLQTAVVRGHVCAGDAIMLASSAT
jgi:sugar/nucleoside kinase (ribokinase family)